ncbi:MAG TPA: L-threonylcarbamoyladenylate synthase [Saprospiraceae bacterium]|nr:L-threonylcarbamoyladenylate synthase [Saprospiraceae bacterium]
MNRETIQKVIEQAVFVLQRGGIILYPADTIWGIGCDASNPEAVRRVYEIKGRAYTKPLIVLVASLHQLYEVAKNVHPRIDTLLHYHERPLTIIYPGTQEPYRHLAAADGSIAVRMVGPCFCQELIQAFGKPLVSTSANLSGEPSPMRFGNISTEIIRQVDLALPAFTEKDLTGKPSVIARYDENGELDFIR